MITLTAEQIAELLDALEDARGDTVGSEVYQIAVHWEDKVCVSSYDLATVLCKKAKALERRRRDCDRFFAFADDSFVEYGDLGSDFIAFMMRHVRDTNLDLPTQIRQVHEWLVDHDYSNTFRG